MRTLSSSPCPMGRIAIGVTTLLALTASIASAAPPRSSRGDPTGNDSVAIEGRIVCLDEALQPVESEEECNDPGARYALRNTEGRLHHFMPGDLLAEMFIDPRVRARTLHVVGWQRANDHFEIVSVYSIKEGRLHHLHYRCDVCDITANAPGPCWCCRKDFEFREVPAEEMEP